MADNFLTNRERSGLKQIAIEELTELVEQIDVSFQGDCSEDGTLKDLKRMFHTIGGSAGLAGLKEISDIGFRGESLFSKKLSPDETIAALRPLWNDISGLLERIKSKNRGPESPGNVNE